MTIDFGKGFTPTNLKYMIQFYLTFPNSHALRGELSWTHYRLLLRVENEKAREFYTEEAIKSNWSTRQLERQINSFFYERLLSSQNKEKVSEEIQKLEPTKVPENVIRDPYVLEFLGLSPNDDFYESDLEEVLNQGDNPPIGIVLCADKSESVVKYTLPENETQIFTSKYKLYLPSEEELSQELQREYRALENDKEKSK